MVSINVKKYALPLLTSALLLAGASASQAAVTTYTCTDCAANSFMSGSISYNSDSDEYDWSMLTVSPGKGGLPEGDDFDITDITDSTDDEAGFEYTIKNPADPFAAEITGSLAITSMSLLALVIDWDFDNFEDIYENGSNTFEAAPSAVPVPAAAFLFAPALLGFLGLRRKNRA